MITPIGNVASLPAAKFWSTDWWVFWVRSFHQIAGVQTGSWTPLYLIENGDPSVKVQDASVKSAAATLAKAGAPPPNVTRTLWRPRENRYLSIVVIS